MVGMVNTLICLQMCLAPVMAYEDSIEGLSTYYEPRVRPRPFYLELEASSEYTLQQA